VLITVAFVVLFEEVEALSYEIFMWGDIGMVSDVRYYGVAPHWYFRPFMAWLIACPFHKTGIFGLVYFFVSVYFQPSLHGSSEQGGYARKSLSILAALTGREDMFVSDYTFLESNLYYQTFYFFFVWCALYTTSFLPYGRFFNRLGGNWGFLGAYFFVFFYLGFRWMRRPLLLELLLSYLYAVSFYVRSVKRC
jgi:hypothetical protein